jgi:DNA-binding transcriptional LysR family regulator
MANILDSIPWARRLKIRHLEVFVVLNETRNLTEAATRLHMTQPALSRWLADAEEAVGRALFLRDRRLSLTVDGEVVLAHAQRMLGDVQRTHAELQAVRQGLQGRLNVGTGLPRVLLPRSIARLHEDRPGVFVSIVEAPLPNLLQMLSRRELDVIIGAVGLQALQSGFTCEALLPDSVQIVAGREHPLLRLSAPDWNDTLRYPWILPPKGSVMRTAFDEAFARQGLEPPTACVEGNSSMRLQLLMGERDYVSILAATEVHLYGPVEHIHPVPVTPEIVSPDIGIIWSADRAGAMVSAFLNAVRAEAAAARRDSPGLPAVSSRAAKNPSAPHASA